MIKTRPSPTLLLTMTLFCGLTLSCDQRPSPKLEGVLVTVNGTPITEVDLAFASRGTGGHQQTPSADKAKVLEGIILQELAYQYATKLGLDADPKYQAELRAMDAQLNAFKRKKLSAMLLQQELLKKTTISDAEVMQYFNENTARLRTEINVWQILRRDESTIKNIQHELAQGLAFEEVARKQFSNLANTDQKPWELGYLQWHKIPDVWQSSINNIQIGDTSDIIRGPRNRFWIIKLIDRRENPEITFEQLKPKITEILKNEKFQRLREKTIQDLRDKARIVYSQ